MKSKIYVMLIMLLYMTVMASAANTLTHYARNAYDFTPLENAHITVFCNETNLSVDGFSDTTGKTEFSLDVGNYTIFTNKSGFNPDEVYYNLDDAYTKIAYLTYLTSSQTKIVFTDLTIGAKQWCFYGRESSRLIGCYDMNETVFLPDGNYSVYPKTQFIEQAGLFSTVSGFLGQIFVFIIVLLIGLMLLLAAFIIVYRLIK